MKDTTRQKYIDAMNERSKLIEAADAAFADGKVQEAKELTERARAMNEEIGGYQMLMDEEKRFAAANPPATSFETRDRAEERFDTLRRGGVIQFTREELVDGLGLPLRSVQNTTTLATGTLVEPTRVGTTIRDGIGPVSSIIDQVYVQDLTGCGAILEPLLTAEAQAQAGAVTSLAGTARTASDPTFAAARIAPYEVDITSFVDRNISRLTPVAYEEKIRSLAMRSLRRKIADIIYNGDGQVTPDFRGIKTAADTAGNALYKTVYLTAISAGFLDALVFGYGGDEEIGGNARLFLHKSDLQAIGALRSDDGKRLYEIIPDPANANTGRIVDGGLIVPYTIGSALTAFSASTAGAADIQTMVYGDPANFELGLFGSYSIRIDESVKAVERMNAILGDVMVGGNLIVKNGFCVGTLKAAEAGGGGGGGESGGGESGGGESGGGGGT